MGKKPKTGKARKDKFYQLAKETGYRSRAAFKLIQLNRKFEFLQSSKVIIDLCAAPGGWMQVVAENAPVSNLIIGVDLVPIKPIHNCVSLQEDITTDKCRQELKKKLQTWKADCVLNDGAGNVGKNWIHDAFQQAQLTLQALKLATVFLKKGGWFVTKVFRSKDYNALLWVFQQLFRQVHATKPKASRSESAEIFVVCQNYLAPDKIDPKFLDLAHVFKDLDQEPKHKLDLQHPEKHTRQREGYPEGDFLLFHTLKASEFISGANHLELLAKASEIVLDTEDLSSHSETTSELKECLKDIKVLGKRELRLIINWRKKIRKDLNAEKPEDKTEEVESEDEEAKIDKQIAAIKDEDRLKFKRKIRKVRKEKSKLQHKMDMKMVLPNDLPDLETDINLFNLKKIKNKEQLEEVETGDLSLWDAELAEGGGSDDDLPMRKRMEYYDRENPSVREDMDQWDSGDEEGELEWEGEEDADSENEDNADEEGDRVNPLVVSLEDKDSRTQRQLDMWFSKESFAGLEGDEDEDMEVQKMAEDYKKRGGVVLEKSSKVLEKGAKRKRDDPPCSLSDEMSSGSVGRADAPLSSLADHDKESEDTSDSDSNSGSDYDPSEIVQPQQSVKQGKKISKSKASQKDGFEIVSAQETDAENLKLDPEGLAIGAAMVHSRKRRREIVNAGYHRYMFDDTGLPDWFSRDESKHQKRARPVTKADVEEYRERMKDIDARPIKKIAEAKARKKKKEMRKLEKIRKKADTISDSVDVSEREKWNQIKNIYKSVLNTKKKEVTYVVAKKGVGRRVRRPAGVQGPFKVVDPRMKKDHKSLKGGKGKKGGTNQRKGKNSAKKGSAKSGKGKR